MNPTNINLAKGLINPSYVYLAQNALNSQQNILTYLLSQRQLPQEPLSQNTIHYILNILSLMDTNNFEGKCGVGERQSRIYSSIVKQRHFHMGHGIGRSGDVMANQPKAAGSSLLLQLTRYLTISALKIMNYGFVNDVLLVPLATGMALTICLLTMKQLKPDAKYVIWPRIDQKTCLKCIQAANLIPVIIQGIVEQGDSICTNLKQITTKIEEIGSENIVAVFTTSSCFAPRVFDSLEQVSQICKKYNIFHLLNNAYGLQCSKIANSVKQSMKIKLDCVVQSMDKNFMVPVGGSIIFTSDQSLLQKITTKYPGRACGAPITDLFITLLEMGKSGLKTLYQTRKANFIYMKQKATQFAQKYNQRLLQTKRNSISLAITIGNIVKNSDPTELGSILFSKKVMGHRIITEKKEGKVFGIDFRNYGSHFENYECLPYINIACAIGSEKKEIDQFFHKLDEAIKQINKKQAKLESKNMQKSKHKQEVQTNNNNNQQKQKQKLFAKQQQQLKQELQLLQNKQVMQDKIQKVQHGNQQLKDS